MALVTTTNNFTRRQAQLIDELRVVEQDIQRLVRRRNSIKDELDKIYPQARTLTTPPKERGTIISIWNYAQQGYTCRITTTTSGIRAISDPNPIYFTDADLVIMALASKGADATKLLAVRELTTLTDNPKRRIAQLATSNFVELTFTLKGI